MAKTVEMSKQFEDFYRATYDKVYNYAFSYLLDPLEAEDATSEVFLRAVSRHDWVNFDEESFSTWILGIAHAVLNDSRQEDARHESPGQVAEGKPSLGNTPGDAHQIDAVELFARLEKQDRELAFLKFFEGADDSAIAQIMQMSPASVAEHLKRLDQIALG